jgi:stage II sporulation protein E
VAAVGLACGTVAAASIPPCVEDRFYCLAAYGAGGLAGAFCAATPGEALAFLEAVAVGGVGFVLLPKRYLLRDEAGESDPAICAERPAQAAAATRLGAVAASLGGIAETVNDVYTALPRKTEDYRWVLDNTHDTLCFNCGRREECWGSACTATRCGLEALRPILEQKGSVEVEDLPGQLARCIHPAALSGAVSRSFALYRSRRAARVHAEAMRTALTEQYGAVAEALDALAHQLGAPGSPDPYKSGRVEALFAGMGMQPLECSVTLDDLGRMRAAVTLPTPRLRCREADLAVLAEEVGRICRRRMDLPQKLSCRGMTTLLFAEKPLLRAVFGAAGAAARGTLSGDAVQQFCTAGAAQMILCDGMGTGRPAALDGNLAAELTARLLKAGFTAELSARLVNVALALKGEDEGGATLDLVSVDLYTGTARLYKAGAAPGFIVHGGQARAVGEASLPVGILGAVNGQSRMVHLAAGDLAVLVSDGLLVDGVGWVLQQLQLSAAAQDPPAKIAAALVDAARVRAQRTGRPDDITAAVLKLETV